MIEMSLSMANVLIEKNFNCNANNIFLHNKGSMKKEYNSYGSHVKEEIHRV